MTDPRTPESKREEAQLPDPLDQNPAAADAAPGRHGSEDAQLLAGEAQGEADVERETPSQDSALAND